MPLELDSPIRPLHPAFGEFWRAEEKRLLADVQSTEPGSLRQMVASHFFQAAAANVRLLTERETSIAFAPWAFYIARANHIAAQFQRASCNPGDMIGP